MADIVAGDDQVGADLVDAAEHDVRVRVVGVPVVDGHPVEPRAEIRLHAGHEVAGVGAQVAELGRILGRDDEPELMAVVLDARLERLGVGPVLGRRIDLPALTFASDAVALDVAQVRRGRAGLFF